jgi:hypothetical protein
MSKNRPARRNALRMNQKRKKLLEGVSRGLNISEAGRAAGYGTAQSAHRAMNLIRIHMPEVLDKIGFPAEKLLKNLIKSVDATKKLYFSHRGVVKDTREVPDHDIQLRALIELAKMYCLYPRGNQRKSANGSDGYSPPIVNLVIPSLEGSNTKTQRPADPADLDRSAANALSRVKDVPDATK